MPKFISKLPFQLPIIILLCIIIYILFREYKSLKYQKRFESFSLESAKDPEISFIDLLIEASWKWFEKCSQILNKNEFFKLCGQKYEKYLILENTHATSGMNYFVIKLLSAILFFFLILFTWWSTFFYFSIFHGFIACLIGFLLPDIILHQKYQHQRKKREENLYHAITIMAHSFSSGKNILQALESVVENLEGPLKKEFLHLQKDLTYGLSLEIVLERFYKRTKIEKVKYLTSVLTTMNQTGGSISKAFENITNNMQKEKQFQMEQHYLLAPTMVTTNILIAIPPLLVLLIICLNPSYFDPFFQTPYGFLTLLGLGILYFIYIIIINKLKRGGYYE